MRGSAWKTKTLMMYKQGREERILTLNSLSIFLGTFLKDGHTWTSVLVMFFIYFRPKVERTEERPEFSNIQVQFTPELVKSVSEGVRFPGEHIEDVGSQALFEERLILHSALDTKLYFNWHSAVAQTFLVWEGHPLHDADAFHIRFCTVSFHF